MKAPGKGLLKVSSILLIIFGGLGLLLGALTLAGYFTPGVVEVVAAQTGLSAGILLINAIAVVVLAVLNIVAGILGVKNCDKVEKAQTCFTVGIILILLVIVEAAIAAVSGGLKWYSIVIGLVLPVLYLMGALKNKEVASVDVQVEQVADETADSDK